MSEATAANAPPDPAQRFDALLQQAIHECREARKAAAGRLEQRSDIIALAELSARLGELQWQMHDTALALISAEEEIPAAEPAPRSHRRRKPAKPGKHLSSVPLIAAIGGAVAAFAARFWAAHRILAPVALAAMAGSVAVVVQSQPAHTLPDYASTARPPAAIAYAAVPVPSSSPPAVPGRAKPAVVRSRPLAVQVPPSVSSSSPSASAAPSVSPSPVTVAPLLSLSTGLLNLGVYLTGSVEISNPRQQAVSWTVDCGEDAHVAPAQGVLEPGQQDVQLQVSVNPVDGLSGTWCTFEPGGEQVQVSWAGAGLPSSLGL